MKTVKFWAIFTTVFLLASCAQMNPHPMDMTNAIRNANTSADHNGLALHYEGVANDMRRRARSIKRNSKNMKAIPIMANGLKT